MADNQTNPPIQATPATSHPFKAHYHGKEDGSPGYLAVESGYVIPSGVIEGYEAILPKLNDLPLQDQHHTGELTNITNPAVGDYYMEATGTWHKIGAVGSDSIEQFQPVSAKILHRDALTLTDDAKRALKVFRLESDGRVSQYIKSDIPMEVTRNVTTPPDPPDPPPTEGGSSSSSSSSSSSGSAGSSSSSGPPPYNYATFVYQKEIPIEMEGGTTTHVELRFRNNGTTTWTYPNFRLLSQNPPVNYNWGTAIVPIATTTPPGVERSFTFAITAPMTPGVYNFQWQMNQYGGSSFGQKSVNVPITVLPAGSSSSSSGSGEGSESSSGPPSGSSSSGPPTTLVHDSVFVSQMDVPETMESMSDATVMVTFRNVGTTTWTRPKIVLTTVPYGEGTWSALLLELPETTPPGVERTFWFDIHAPVTPGVYRFQWQLYDDDLDMYFGDPSVLKWITVTPLPSDSSGGPPSET